MAELAIIRRMVLLPGREQAGLRWLERTEPSRGRAGQVRQLVVRSQTDPQEFLWIQVWESPEAYQAWRRSPDRSELARERGRFMTHEPTRLYEVVD